MRDRRYDLVVLGAGSAGLTAARTAAGIGARVALLDERPGGECLWTGCIPSKSLIASAERAQAIRSADRFGIEAAEPKVDFAAVMARVRSVIEQAGRPDSPAALRAAGIDVIEARARFVEPGVLDADGRLLRWRAALIATGSRPSLPPISGLYEANPLTSDTVFDLESAPRRLAVLGGGPIGCELGQALARLGVEVTIVEAAPRLLSAEDPEASHLIEVRLRAEGVAVVCDATVEQVETAAGGSRLRGRTGAAEELGVEFDRLLVATGRDPAVEDLELDRVGVELGDRGGVAVDDRLRTTGDHIYAAGDVIGERYLTHFAGYQGLVAAANAVLPIGPKFDRSGIPAATFTDPEIASVGLDVNAARARLGREPLVLRRDYSELDRALTASAGGFAKLVCDRRGRLLGATIAGPRAGESIVAAARLVREGGKVAELSQTIHPYPTFAEGPARAADGWWDHRYLTPATRRLMRPLLTLLRRVDRPRVRRGGR